MTHLRCPQCRLTVPASAYYLRGDVCPRCLADMEACDPPARKLPAAAAATVAAPGPRPPRPPAAA